MESKRLITVKTFFEYIFSDENTQGVTISENAIEQMDENHLNVLRQMLKNCIILPYHCLYDWTVEDEKQGDFKTKDLELVRFVQGDKKYQ